MTRPEDHIAGCLAAEERLLATLAALTDAQARQPSRLPDWTVGHVVAHIARNGDSVIRRLDGAARGEVVDQYPGGADQRTGEIEAGAPRSAAELVADVEEVHARLAATIAAMPDAAWDNATRPFGGPEQPASQVLFQRWREVEVHHVDIGLGYGAADWPDDLVDVWLPTLLDRLPTRADRHDLLAWLIGRGDPPTLANW